MEKFTNWMEEKVGPIAARIAANNSIRAVSKAFTALLPVTMTGSLVSLINYIKIGNLQDTFAAIGITDAVTLIVNVTINCMALYLVIALGIIRARDFVEESEARVVGFLTLLAFLILTPMPGGGFLHLYFGAAGLITAIIIGLTVPPLYKLLTSKGLTLRLPDSVPDFVADSFKGIPTGFVIVICGVIINKLCNLAGFMCLSELIMGTLGVPLRALTSNFLTGEFLSILNNLFWWFGIHGGMTVGQIQRILFMQPTIENIAAGAQGLPLPNIITGGFAELCGGSVHQLACVTALLIFCKREDLKAVGKIALAPAFFSISEPLRFGLPIVLNPYLFVPAVLYPPFMETVGYFLCKIGLLARPRIPYEFGLPVFVGAFAMGGISAVIYNIFVYVLEVFVWSIFLRMYENAKNREDLEAAK